MTLFYGLILLLGATLAGVWLVMVALSGSVDGWEHVNPELTWGERGRFVVAGLIGFGMAGISMLYTTWPEFLSVVGGIVGAAVLIVVSRYFGPTTSA